MRVPGTLKIQTGGKTLNHGMYTVNMSLYKVITD